ncbi:hypothetical protein F5876DRAFT_45456 [Lentinula aff. lateritia]|uniref:Uncharacterized protein n=1 Tax=Lentinula aff. lateritia TaxID=2804960 RepID=A0ACC1TVB8_9AGAR|nr:hypothetical protein F5876DRAFT_45456 [Lentinula aff. lateritia]
MATDSSVDEVYLNAPVVLITGCSTGLGRSLVLEAASQGLRVIATARKLSAIENLRAPNIAVLTLDVTASMSQLEEFANKALTVFGQVDILINNAGYPLAGALEEVSSDQTLAIFKTNFFGSLNVSNVFLPHFRARRSGTIINISSMMPYISTPGSGSYTATKAALDSITQVWAHELAPLKIKVMGVSLGFTRTELLGPNLSTVENTVKNPIPDYANVRAFHEQVRALHGHEPNDVQKVAKRILDVVLTHDELPVMFPLGNDAVTSADEYLNQRRSEFEKWKEFGMGVDADKDDQTEKSLPDQRLLKPKVKKLGTEFSSNIMATDSSVGVYSNSPVILITGCSTGLGRALVLEAASQGLRVIATARKLSAIENLRAPNIAVLTLDVTASMSQLEEFANKALTVFGQIDILINNAGYPLAGALEEVSSDQTLAIFKTNFFGSLNVSNVFLPHFRARRSGTIINISSMMPCISTPGSGSYTATKAALDSITKVWAHELAPLKIRVMSVSLGFTRTELLGSNLSTVENTVKNPVSYCGSFYSMLSNLTTISTDS